MTPNQPAQARRREIALLDATSLARALTEAESRRLEQLIRRDRRATRAGDQREATARKHAA